MIKGRLALTAVGLLVGMLWLLWGPVPHSEAVGSVPDQTQILGFTLSPHQAGYLGLRWERTVEAAMSLSPSVVRVGAYWEQIEPRAGQYDFSSLDRLLERTQRGGKQIILTVGMKAPRWPEYYLPGWMEQRCTLPPGADVAQDPLVREGVLRFVSAVVERYQDSDLIAYWQVENEPLDPSGPQKWVIGKDLLKEEVALVRSLDQRGRPIIGTVFVPTHPLARFGPFRAATESRAKTILEQADVLGLDVYPSIGLRLLGRDIYLDWSNWPWEAVAVGLRDLAHRQGKPAWIMEAQAEPWEPGKVVDTSPSDSRSVHPDKAVRVYERLRQAGFDTILLWGVEHWYMRRVRHRDPSWWDRMAEIFSQV